MERREHKNYPLVDTLDWDVQPLRDDYRELPVEDGFNWDKLIAEVVEAQGATMPNYYLVVFRSTRLPDAGLAEYLTQLDRDSLSEAKSNLPGALLHYFAGEVDASTNKAMSWCLWADRASAREAIYSPVHTQAIRAAREGKLYERYDVERFMIHLGEADGLVFDPLNPDAQTHQSPTGCPV